jgi:hypothetical protein
MHLAARGTGYLIFEVRIGDLEAVATTAADSRHLALVFE